MRASPVGSLLRTKVATVPRTVAQISALFRALRAVGSGSTHCVLAFRNGYFRNGYERPGHRVVQEFAIVRSADFRSLHSHGPRDPLANARLPK